MLKYFYDNHLIKTHLELSWRLWSHVINLWSAWPPFGVTTSTLMVSIQTHKVRHLHYDAVIRNHEHYLQYGIHVNDLQKYFEACPIVSNITTNCLKAHCKYLWKEPKVFTNKSPWGMKAHDKHVLLMPILWDAHSLAQTN